MTERHDRWLGGGAFAAGAGIIAATRGLHGLPHGVAGPDLFPALVGIGLMTVGGVLVVGRPVRKTPVPSQSLSKEEGRVWGPCRQGPIGCKPRCAGWSVLGAGAWVVFVDSLGFGLATVLLLGGLLWCVDRHPLRDLAASVGITVILVAGLTWGLGVPLPEGVISGLAGVFP